MKNPFSLKYYLTSVTSISLVKLRDMEAAISSTASTNEKRENARGQLFYFCGPVACLLLHFIILRGQKSPYIAITLPTSLKLIVPNYFVFLFLIYWNSC